MSEATTIILADGLYAHCLLQDGFEYKSMDQRRIYPMVAATHVLDGGLDIQKLRTLLLASMEFCLTGSAARLRDLVGEAEEDQAALNQ